MKLWYDLIYPCNFQNHNGVVENHPVIRKLIFRTNSIYLLEFNLILKVRGREGVSQKVTKGYEGEGGFFHSKYHKIDHMNLHLKI